MTGKEVWEKYEKWVEDGGEAEGGWVCWGCGWPLMKVWVKDPSLRGKNKAVLCGCDATVEAVMDAPQCVEFVWLEDKEVKGE
jgi:hypothetical protein